MRLWKMRWSRSARMRFVRIAEDADCRKIICSFGYLDEEQSQALLLIVFLEKVRKA